MCHILANRLLSMDIPEPKEDVSALPFSDAEEANFWFFLAAICHQTSPVGQPALAGDVDGVSRRGWDYLVHAFRLAATQNTELLTPKAWASFDSTSITALFSPSISQPQRRAELVVDLGRVLTSKGWDSILSASLFCDHYISNHRPNLLELLSDFDAYSDPVQKKSVFFLALMQNCGLWRYADPESLPAPVDYHEVRGHLRIGTVRLLIRNCDDASSRTNPFRAKMMWRCEWWSGCHFNWWLNWCIGHRIVCTICSGICFGPTVFVSDPIATERRLIDFQATTLTRCRALVVMIVHFESFAVRLIANMRSMSTA